MRCGKSAWLGIWRSISRWRRRCGVGACSPEPVAIFDSSHVTQLTGRPRPVTLPRRGMQTLPPSHSDMASTRTRQVTFWLISVCALQAGGLAFVMAVEEAHRHPWFTLGLRHGPRNTPHASGPTPGPGRTLRSQANLSSSLV
jgi:hypothetical protein